MNNLLSVIFKRCIPLSILMIILFTDYVNALTRPPRAIYSWDGKKLNNILDDIDRDGIANKVDNCRLKSNLDQRDTDKDGKGNVCDSDDDNDGVPDNKDAFPYSAKESVDTDLDGIGNNADRDDDNDGFLDYQDAFPLDRNKSKSMAYCGLNMIMTCDRKGICRDRHYPDPRCLKPTREPNASKLRLLGFDSNRDGIRDDIERKNRCKIYW